MGWHSWFWGPRSNSYSTLQLVPKLSGCLQACAGEEGRNADDVADIAAPVNISVMTKF